MIKFKKIMFAPEFDHIYLLPLGDMHVGDPAGLGGSSVEGKYATKKFDRMVKWLQDTPEAFTFLMGDLYDTGIKTSKANVHNQDYNIKTARDYLYEKLLPIKEKTLGIISGNHEERMEREVGDNPAEILAQLLGIEYFPNWCAYLFLGVGNNGNRKDRRRPYVYTVYLHHMIGGGRTKGGKLNRVAMLKEMILADVYCGAHVHIKGAFKGKYLYPDINNYQMREQQQTYVATGSFMGYAEYAIKGQYDKPSTGAVRIRLNGETERGKDTHVNI